VRGKNARALLINLSFYNNVSHRTTPYLSESLGRFLMSDSLKGPLAHVPSDRRLTTLRPFGSRASRDTGPRHSRDPPYAGPPLLAVKLRSRTGRYRLVSRTYPYELPKLHEHKFTSHTPPRNILYMNKLTMLFARVLNWRSNSLQLWGHDTIQVAKKMAKNSRDNSHSEQSSQQLSQGPTKYQTDLSRRRT